MAFVRSRGIVLESGQGLVPSLASKVVGKSIHGSWWGHPKRHAIFRLSRAVRASPQVLVCRLVDGKVTYVHRRLWPALVRLAKRFPRQRLAAIREVHTRFGRHEVTVKPYPLWVPRDIWQAATNLSEEAAISQLAMLLRKR